MLHGKNFKCQFGSYIFQQCFLSTITAYNVFPSPPWQAPFLWGVVLQATLLNCCLRSRGSIQHLWPRTNIIFKSYKILWTWKETITKAHQDSCKNLCSCPVCRHTSEPDWWTDLAEKLAEGNNSSGCVRTAQRREGTCGWLPLRLRAAKPVLWPEVRLCTHSLGLFCE